MKNAIKYFDRSLGEKTDYYLSKVQKVANIGFWELDLNSGKSWWSDELFQIFQFDPKEGSPNFEKYSARIHPEDYEYVMRSRSEAINKKQGYKIKLRIIRMDGSIRHLMSYGEILLDSQNNPIGLFGVVQDETDLVQKDLFANEQNLRLTQQSHLIAVGEMASGLAHEINNPLAIIVGKANKMIQDLNHELKTENNFNLASNQQLIDFKKNLEIIEKTAQRASKIIRLLQSIRANKAQIHFSKISLEEVLKSTLMFCNEKILNQGITISINNNDPNDIFVNGNQSELVQVFLTLINNSYDAVVGTENKWIKIEISQNPESDVIITITDSGPIISDFIVNKMMTPFFTTKPVGQGVGLNLCVARNIIERHNGVLNFLKNESHTTFQIRLPNINEVDLIPLSLEEALQAHLKWNQKIVNYVLRPDGKLNDKQIELDNSCALGKWIYHSKNNFTDNPHYKELKEVHKKFHKIAAYYIEQINKNNTSKPNPAEIFSDSSQFTLFSKKIINLIELLKTQ